MVTSNVLFYYWEHYKERTHIRHGDDIESLYLEKKYASFKQETLSHIDIHEYNDRVLFKADSYYSTVAVRQFAVCSESDAKLFRYGIKKGSSITICHLMALIIYCDFPALSRRFKDSFRALSRDDNLCAIKRRNQQFWWLSKTLRECVELYGVGGHLGGVDPKTGVRHEDTTGPFWCTAPEVVVLSRFNVAVSCPTSTSTERQRAPVPLAPRRRARRCPTAAV